MLLNRRPQANAACSILCWILVTLNSDRKPTATQILTTWWNCVSMVQQEARIMNEAPANAWYPINQPNLGKLGFPIILGWQYELQRDRNQSFVLAAFSNELKASLRRELRADMSSNFKNPWIVDGLEIRRGKRKERESRKQNRMMHYLHLQLRKRFKRMTANSNSISDINMPQRITTKSRAFQEWPWTMISGLLW